MQCVLESHMLYRKEWGRDKFLLYMLDLNTWLLMNSPKLESPLGLPLIDNLVRHIRKSHWPEKRESPDCNKMNLESRNAGSATRGIKTPSGNEIKLLGSAKVVQDSQVFIWTKINLKSFISKKSCGLWHSWKDMFLQFFGDNLFHLVGNCVLAGFYFNCVAKCYM